MNLKRIIVPVDMQGERLDLIISRLSELRRKKAKALVESGYVMVNGIKVTFPSKRLVAGDKITLIKPLFPKIQIRNSVRIIYEDSCILIVDKPPGILTNKEEVEKGDSVEEILVQKGKAVYPVHRLDKETSGVLVFAKTESARDFLMEEFKKRKVYKKYIGVVEGVVRKDKGIIKSPVREKEYAETEFKVLKRLRQATIVEFNPRTGRTHQIRRQLAKLGYHLVGEKKYISLRQPAKIFFPRQSLHAVEIKFIHPVTRKYVQFFSPIPEDMNKLIKFLSSGKKN